MTERGDHRRARVKRVATPDNATVR